MPLPGGSTEVIVEPDGTPGISSALIVVGVAGLVRSTGISVGVSAGASVGVSAGASVGVLDGVSAGVGEADGLTSGSTTFKDFCRTLCGLSNKSGRLISLQFSKREQRDFERT